MSSQKSNFLDHFNIRKKKSLKAIYSGRKQKIRINKSAVKRIKKKKITRLALTVLALLIISQICILTQTAYFDALRLVLKMQDGSYLIGFQNSGELRPTGGFWGSFAVLDVGENIKDCTLAFETNPYKKDNILLNESKVSLPKPMAETWEDRPQTFVNANWSFNYPEAAKTLEWYFSEGWNKKIDGVIAISSLTMIDLLKVTGPVELPDGSFATSDNFTKIMSEKIDEEYWQNPENKVINEPKTLIKELFPRMLEKIKKTPKLKLIKFANAQIKQGHILAFFNESERQNIAKKLNLSGELKSYTSDYLSVNNANLNGGKTSLNVEQSVKYNVSKNDEGMTSTLEISRYHQSSGWPQILNRNWTRVIVPLGSKIISAEINGENATNEVNVEEEEGRTTFGFWLSTDPGEEKTAKVVYNLPTKDSKNYSLIYQKQPGTIAESVSITEFGKQVFSGQINRLYNKF